MATQLVLAQRARLHEGHAARSAGVLARPRVILVVQFNDVIVAGQSHVTQLKDKIS